MFARQRRHDRDNAASVSGVARTWPVFVYLHGGGAQGLDALLPTVGGLANDIRARREALMPYELSFTKRLHIPDRGPYINECCVGGDIVVNQLLAAVEARYTQVQTEQEDWGWFIWCRDGTTRLAVDVFTDDPETGAFRIHLTSRIKRALIGEKIVDTAELEELRRLVTSELSGWIDGTLAIELLDEKDM